MPYVVIAIYTVRPGEESRVAEALATMMPLSRGEPGCRAYEPARSLEDPRVFALYECYDDEAAFKEHASSAHFERHIKNTVWPLLADRVRVLGTPLGGGE